MKDRLRVGIITKPHGVKGEVRVFPTTDDTRRFELLEEVYLEEEGESPYHISSVKYQKNMVILGFRECGSMNEAELLRNRELWINRDQALPLEEGQYFLCDAIGLPLITEEGETVGVLQDILETGANRVFQVKTEEGKIYYFPDIPQCIKKVDVEQGVITVFVMPGLMDEGGK